MWDNCDSSIVAGWRAAWVNLFRSLAILQNVVVHFARETLPRPPGPLIRTAVFACGFLGVLAGCTCEESTVAKNTSGTGGPLVDRGAPAKIQAEIYPAVGAVGARPVTLVLAADAGLCTGVRRLRSPQLHVLCLPSGFSGDRSEVEPIMKGALSFLKQTYPPYVAKAPVHLVCDVPYSELGLQWMLAEAAVFGHAYLPGVPVEKVTSTLLYSLFSAGAETLLLQGPIAADKAPLLSMAERGGLLVEAVGPVEVGLARALDEFARRDPRVSGALAPSPRVSAPTPAGAD